MKLTNNGRTVLIEDAVIGFKNFAGKVGPYNKNGERDFVVFLDPEVAEQLEKEEWNIKWPKPNDDIPPEEDTRKPYFNVKVEFGDWPPKAVMIVGETATLLDEDRIAELDTAEIVNVDLEINPYHWQVNGKQGVKAYLKAIYATLDTSGFAAKYGI